MVLDLEYGVLIECSSVISLNVTIRQNVTVRGGEFDGEGKNAIIVNNVQIGANSLILGPIKVGNHSQIGAGSVVVNDVPDFAVVVGNPARVIKYNNVLDEN